MLHPTRDDDDPAATAAPTGPEAMAPGPDFGATPRILGRLATHLGWGMLALGILRGSSHALLRIGDAPSGHAESAGALLDALSLALAFGLAGWAIAAACRLAEATLIARADRSSRSDERLDVLAARAVAAFERLAEARELRPAAAAAPTSPPPDLERGRLLARFDQAVRADRREEAESLFGQFTEQFPDDPAIAEARERLEAARRREAEDRLALLDAARKVNDTERVLEHYRAAGPALESDRRGELERELARWFLDLIHRRLRLGRIQVEVVELATQVAETFAATVEGASLRASLPTLRRSVGLCPRCAQPYTGMAAACPRCLAPQAAPPPPDPETPEEAPDEEE